MFQGFPNVFFTLRFITSSFFSLSLFLIIKCIYIYMSKKIWKLSLFMEEMIQGRGKTGKETRQVNTTEVHKYHSTPK